MGGRPLVHDSTLGAQCAALVEWCTLSRLSVPSVVEQELTHLAGQLIVMSWGVDVVGAADRFLAVVAACRGGRTEGRRRSEDCTPRSKPSGVRATDSATECPAGGARARAGPGGRRARRCRVRGRSRPRRGGPGGGR